MCTKVTNTNVSSMTSLIFVPYDMGSYVKRVLGAINGVLEFFMTQTYGYGFRSYMRNLTTQADPFHWISILCWGLKGANICHIEVFAQVTSDTLGTSYLLKCIFRVHHVSSFCQCINVISACCKNVYCLLCAIDDVKAVLDMDSNHYAEVTFGVGPYYHMLLINTDVYFVSCVQ